MEISKLIRDRKTAESFKPSVPDRGKLVRVLDAGRLAPSAKNRQPWRFIAITDPSLKSSLKESCYGDDRIETSSAVILLCTTNIDYRMPNGQLSYPMDISFAASYMMLQAEAEGLASALLSTYQEDLLKERISIPYSMRVPLILLVGERGEDERSPKRRLDQPRVFSFDHW